ncbi:LPXTG cell wall anchor domain-containing protein [Arsenicicoccus cauae]|uniref:LPXTG cell wall anchor domain-containing protein n=1 Tax=Arsenicicoccus cauae TaxID=2663847 RepID=UPI00370D9331
MSRLLARPAAAAALAVALGSPLASPGVAQAASRMPQPAALVAAGTGLGYLQVSTSPTGPWTRTLDTGIFPAGIRIVPGEPLTGSFYVKNASPDKALLSISSEPDPLAAADEFADDLHVTAAVDGTADPTPQAPTASTLATTPGQLTSATVPAGGVVRVELAALLPQSATGDVAEDYRWDTPISVSLSMAATARSDQEPVPVEPSTSPAARSPAATPTPSASPSAAPSASPSAAPSTSPSNSAGGAGDSHGGGIGQAVGSAKGNGSAAGGAVPAEDAFGVASSPFSEALAHTGADGVVLLAAGGAAVGIGILLLALARRRREDPDES